jgi:hypothetical protein
MNIVQKKKQHNVLALLFFSMGIFLSCNNFAAPPPSPYATTTQLQAETAARIAGDSDEASARQATDTTLQNNIQTEINNRIAGDAAEASIRQAADTTLQNNIQTEATTRAGDDLAEANARIAGDAALQTSIDNEANMRESADAALHTNIDNLGYRLGTIEGQDLENRLGVLEDQSAKFARIVLVNAVGPTEIDNGNALRNAVTVAFTANPSPSATNPYIILLEPGNYELQGSSVSLPSFIKLKGFDRASTVISANEEVIRVPISNQGSMEAVSIVSRGTSNSAINVFGTLRANDVYVSGRWAINSGQVNISNSEVNGYFACFSRIIKLTAENIKCSDAGSGSLAALQNTSGGEFNIKNSEINGDLHIFDSGGTATTITLSNSKVYGTIGPANVIPSPTQNINVTISNSEVGSLVVGFSGSNVKSTFSTISSLTQSNGITFVSHSLITNLNVTGGSGAIVSSQIDDSTISGGSLSCPFSYDDNFVPFSGGVC